jgi:hypothetical protein
MVMASVESVFEVEKDALFHLDLQGHDVLLEQIQFAKYGKADEWLTSPFFGLRHPRSLPAEEAIEEAKKLQLEDAPTPDAVREAHSRLVRHLAEDDEFWPRWLYFARQHGACE